MPKNKIVGKSKKKPVCCIYKIESPTGRVYIGKTINLKNRIYKYKCNKTQYNSIIYNSISKYGWDKHNLNIIMKLDNPNKTLMNELEKHYIRLYNTYYYTSKNGMNLTVGGDGMQLGTKRRDNKAVYQFNTRGVLINKWENAQSAADSMEIKRSDILECISGRRQTSHGYVWSYSNVFKKPKEPKRVTTKILYNEKEYSSIKEFCRVWNLDRNGILKSCTTGKSYKNILFSKTSEHNIIAKDVFNSPFINIYYDGTYFEKAKDFCCYVGIDHIPFYYYIKYKKPHYRGYTMSYDNDTSIHVEKTGLDSINPQSTIVYFNGIKFNTMIEFCNKYEIKYKGLCDAIYRNRNSYKNISFKKYNNEMHIINIK